MTGVESVGRACRSGSSAKAKVLDICELAAVGKLAPVRIRCLALIVYWQLLFASCHPAFQFLKGLRKSGLPIESP